MAKGLPELGEREMLLPQSVIITPSKPNAWRAARHPDQRYTGSQLAEMRRLGLDIDAIEDVIVRQAVTNREYWWGEGTAAPVYLMPSPIVGERHRGGERQLKVIAPDGQRKWVYADGSISRGSNRR